MTSFQPSLFESVSAPGRGANRVGDFGAVQAAVFVRLVNRLGSFVDLPVRMLQNLHSVRGVLAGDFALCFALNRDDPAGGILDVIVPLGSAEDINHHLQAEERYDYASDASHGRPRYA